MAENAILRLVFANKVNTSFDFLSTDVQAIRSAQLLKNYLMLTMQ